MRSRTNIHAPVVPDEFADTAEAVEITGMTPRTLSNLVARGHLAAYKRPATNRNYFLRTDLEDLVRPKVETPSPLVAENDYVTRSELEDILKSVLESREVGR